MKLDDEGTEEISSDLHRVDAAMRASVQDPSFLRAALAWHEATEAFIRAMIATGAGTDGLMGALLAPTADLVCEIRDESKAAQSRGVV